MRTVYRIIWIISVVMLLSFFILGCERAAVTQAGEPLRFTSFRDIPGVTGDEIRAIEALREKTDHFVFGMMLTTEAFYDSNGRIGGYAVLFCEWLTGLFGIPFKPEIVEWESLLSGLANFEIDFTTTLTATEERRKTYFMTDTIGMHTVQYFRIRGAMPLEQIAETRPIRYAFLEGTTSIDQVTSKLAPGTFEIILAGDTNTLYEMIKSGEADTAINEDTEISYDIYEDVVAGDFFPLMFSPVSFSTQNPALAPIISVMQKLLENGGLRYLTDLYNQGYNEYLRNKLFMRLTGEERRYIQEHPVIRFTAATSNYPVSFFNEAEGQWQGIAFDVLREVGSLTGLDFELANDINTSLPVMLKMMRDGEASMVMELMYSAERAESFIWPETALMVDNSALISRSDYHSISPNEILNMKVGLVMGYAHTGLFREWFPDHPKTKEFEDIRDAFDALGRDEIDAVMASTHDLLILTHYLERTGFKTNYIFNNPVNITFAFNKDEPNLCSIVDKALQMININRFSDQWIRTTFDYRRKVLEAQYPWLIGLSLLFLCVLALLAVFFVRNRRVGKRLEKLVDKRTRDLELQTSMLTTIIDSSPDFIFCKDLKSRYTQCNRSMENFFNITSTDIIGKDDVEAFNFSLETAEEFVREDQRIINEKRPIVFEGFVMAQSGVRKKLIVETIKVPLIQNGKITGIMGMSRDITKRKETENALSLQTAKLQAMFDSLPDVVFCKDLNLKYTQFNKIAEDYNGIKEEDIIGKDDIEVAEFPVDISEKIMEADRIVLREGRRYIIEETVPYYNGVTRILETIRAPLVQDGVMIGLIVIARDITQRKKVERELELQTAMLTTLFDSIPDFIFIKDLNFCYMQCNKSYLAHFGFSREDVIGKNDIEGFRLDPELVEEYRECDRKVLNEGRKLMIEERIPGINGTNPLYETVKAPLVLDGKVIGLLGISHDITEHKEMEEAALAASRSKSAFLANMSHEIRTPMNSIMGFSELAMDTVVSPKTREHLAKIQTNAEWLLQIINDILDISKIESGKMELENIPFDMHELFESCRTLIIPRAVEKGITLHFYAEPSIGKRPLGDPTRLRQVLLNLLSNAVKFTNSGTIKVVTEIKGKSEETATFHFEIKDSGIGMTREQIERIFDPFTQAETGTTRKYGGTGLGLTISKNLIGLMGGTLAVESTPGVGSKFSFDLTFDTVDVNDYEKFERKAMLDEIEKPAFDGEVLLCEDNVMNQQVISEHLARVGLKAFVAENGKAGVETVEGRKRRGERQFDLIFMDIHMPVMDGLEAAERIMGLDTGIPIVAMTANIMASDRETYRTSGMHDCIGKPFTSQELWRCLLKYLRPVRQDGKDKNALQGNTQIEEDLKFQRELKLLFARTNQGRYEEIGKALEEGDARLANRLAHGLKTNAGQIGKASLQQAAGEVEGMLKDGKNLVTEEQLKKLETELRVALEELGPLLKEAADKAGGGQTSTLEAEKAKELLLKLEPLLEEGNLKSLDYIDDLRAVAGSDGLIRQIEDFAFESAIVTLDELKKRIEDDINNSMSPP